MGIIHDVRKLTDLSYLNLYQLHATSIHETPVVYNVASRAKNVEKLKLKTHENMADGVIIYSLYGERRDRVVLVYGSIGIPLTIISMNFLQGLWRKEKIFMRLLSVSSGRRPV